MYILFGEICDYMRFLMIAVEANSFRFYMLYAVLDQYLISLQFVVFEEPPFIVRWSLIKVSELMSLAPSTLGQLLTVAIQKCIGTT